MKRKIWFLLVMMCLLLVGCGKQDNSIVGKWNRGHLLPKDEEGNLQFVPYTTTEYLQFFKDGTVRYVDENYEATDKYEVEGDTVKLSNKSETTGEEAPATYGVIKDDILEFEDFGIWQKEK